MAIVSKLVLALFAYIAYKVVAQIVYYRFLHPLSQFPGNFWGSVTRLWITYHNIKEDEPQTFRELHKQHGKAVPHSLQQSAGLTARSQDLSSVSPPPCSS